MSFSESDDLTPEVQSITDSSGNEIFDEGETSDRKLTIAGVAAAEQSVDVILGMRSQGIATADAAGQWSLSIKVPGVGSYAVRAQVGDEAVSNTRTFTVV